MRTVEEITKKLHLLATLDDMDRANASATLSYPFLVDVLYLALFEAVRREADEKTARKREPRGPQRVANQ